jgi:hypothetical protein
LKNYYQTRFAIVHIHKWGSFAELDEMIPFEFDVYKALLIEHLREENERAKEELERQKAYQQKINSQIKSASRRG